jgi:hypothetical protein
LISKKSSKKQKSKIAPTKYTTVNGVMKINPDYTKYQAGQGVKSTASSTALPVVCSMDDVMQATEVKSASGQELKLSESVSSSIEIMQDPDFMNRFGTAGNSTPMVTDGGVLLESLTAYFSKYEEERKAQNPTHPENTKIAVARQKLKAFVNIIFMYSIIRRANPW